MIFVFSPGHFLLLRQLTFCLQYSCQSMYGYENEFKIAVNHEKMQFDYRRRVNWTDFEVILQATLKHPTSSKYVLQQ